MAHRTSSPRLHISAAPPFHTSKDFQDPDNPVPLSPQWLLPKPVEGKPGAGTVENHVISTPSYGNSSEIVKTSGNGEDAHEGHKRKDVFRPSILDSESGRRDRWRDEERETKFSIRKDRWRDGDKDLGDTRRVDRWTENHSTRHFGETRRGTPDRHNDSGNKEMNFDQRRENSWKDGDKDLGDTRRVDRWTENPSTGHFGETRRGTPDRSNDSGNREMISDQQRESRWNTRWGPDDKEPEVLREKWNDSGKNDNLHLDKGLSHRSTPGKDEKEGDHHLPWRPNSSQSRGRAEPSHYQNVTPNKQVPMFSSGRGRGEDTPPVINLGRARFGSGGSPINRTYLHSKYPGTASDKVENDYGETHPFRYSRSNILDVYRVTNVHTDRKLVDDFVQVPSLTQDEPLEPLAICAPTSEELSVLKGIDKGEIISSSAPQVPKDGRNSTEFTHSRRIKLGNAPLQDRGEDGGSYRVADEVPSNREPTYDENNSGHPGSAWHNTQMGDHASSRMHDSRDVSSDVRERNSDISWSNQPKDLRSQWDNNLVYLSETRDVPKCQPSENSVKRQLTGLLDGEHETRRAQQASPEELSLFYKDPQGRVQGPFKGIDIIGWFEAAYFGIDLLVRLESAATDSPWSQLGDVMPHLRAKARPPPGFSASKLEATEAPVQQSSNTFGNIHSGFSEVEMLKNDSMHRPSSATEAENRFLESLMSGSKSSQPLESLTFSEGLQGFIGNSYGNLGPSGVDGGNSPYLLAKRLAIERQRSLPNPYPYWPGFDAASLPPKSDIVSDAPPHSKLLSSLSDNSRQLHPQHSELIMKGFSDMASTGLNNGVAGWPNYPLQGGLNHFQNDLHRDQNFIPFGNQQQRFQAPSQLSLHNLITENADNPSRILAAEKLLSSGLSQDPQIVNMLQQQYLLQLHSQANAPTQQMPLFDKLILLKQQQQQEEQQLLLRQQQQQEEQQQLLLRQQQQLLSQVLQGHQSHQRFGDLSYEQLQGGGIPVGILHVDSSQLQPPQGIFPMSSQTPDPSVHDDLSTKSLNLPLQVSQDTGYTISSQTPDPSVHDDLSTKSLNLPLQVSQDTGSTISSEYSEQLPDPLFGNISHQKSWDPTLPEQMNETHQKGTLPALVSVGSSLLHEQNRTKEETDIPQKPLSVSECTALSMEQMPDNNYRANGTPLSEVYESGEHSEPVAVSAAASCDIELPPAGQMGKDVEIKPDSIEQQQSKRESLNVEPSVVALRNVEGREAKKATEKKSKKQKSSKSQSSGQAKGLLKNEPLQQSKNSVAEKPNYSEINLNEVKRGEVANETHLKQTSSKGSLSRTSSVEPVDHKEGGDLPANIPGSITHESDSKSFGSVATQNTELPTGRAWKPAPGFKAKSLLEIQQEEQKRAKTEILVAEVATSVNSLSLTTPWVGVTTTPDSTKVSGESHREAGNTEHLAKTKSSQTNKSKKSPLHDLLVEDVKSSSEKDGKVADSISSLQYVAVNSESIDDGNFIEAKNTKRNRKKSSKSKGSGSKDSMLVASSEAPISSSPIEKVKSSRSVQQEKEQLPAIPSGPSLGDFVLWRGEPTSPSPPPAWTIDSGRVPTPISLRDILKQQEKKSNSAAPPNQLPTPQKPQPAQAAQSSGSSRTISSSSPSKAVPSSQINPQASQSKHKGDDDFFWGPIEQSNLETKQSDFPQLATQGSWGSKNVPMKGNSPGSLSRQKSGSGKPTERLLSSSPASSQSLLKLKKDVMTKSSEAKDFRVWCENECVRLIGTKDTSFLEFCLKQSRSEAEMFLIANLGSYDPDHEFIDKFLNYMELLPSDVLEIAFKTQNGHKVAGGMVYGNTDLPDMGQTEGSASKGGKKGKKGKKVSASVLGFNVVSNRIMMGEIQAVED